MNKTTQLKTAVLATVLGVMSPLAMIVPASAATMTWTGSVDDSLSNNANWTTSAPADGDTAVFPSTAPFDSFSSQTVRVVDNDFLSPALNLAKVVFNGEVVLSSTSYTINGLGFTLTEAIEAVMTGNGGDHQVKTSVSLGDDVSFVTSGANSLAVGDTGTVLGLAGNNLTVNAAGGTITLQGIIDGSGGVTVAEGRLNMLAAPGDNFDATVTVSGGEFVVSGTTEGNVTVSGGALMGDSGDTGLLGTVTLNSGSIMPGNSPGCINVTNLVLTGGIYEVEVDGNDRCTEYDSTSVTDDVTLGDGVTALDLNKDAAFTPELDDKFAIITYDEASEVTGYFEDLEDGESFTEDGVTYEINYDDDNAVTLTVLGVSDEAAEDAPDAPDTGLASLITNPFVTMSAAAAVITSLGAVRFTDILNLRK